MDYIYMAEEGELVKKQDEADNKEHFLNVQLSAKETRILLECLQYSTVAVIEEDLEDLVKYGFGYYQEAIAPKLKIKQILEYKLKDLQKQIAQKSGQSEQDAAALQNAVNIMKSGIKAFGKISPYSNTLSKMRKDIPPSVDNNNPSGRVVTEMIAEREAYEEGKEKEKTTTATATTKEGETKSQDATT